MSIACDALAFTGLLLRHPSTLGVLAAVALVLLGVLLRKLGLPRLFWHERPLQRFAAGIAATLLAAEVFLTAYLLDGEQRPGGAALSLGAYAALSASLWTLLLVGCALLRLLDERAAEAGVTGLDGDERGAGRAAGSAGSPADGSPSSLKGAARPATGEVFTGRPFRIAPSIQAEGAQGAAAARVALRIPVRELLAGALVGAVLAWLVVFGLRSPALAPALAAPLAWLRHVRPVTDPLLHLAALAGVLGLLAAGVVLRRRATAAVGICFLLALAVAAQGALEFWLRSAGISWLVVLLALAVAGTRLHKLRLSDLAEHDAAPQPYPPPEHPTRPAVRPLPYDVTRLAWRHQPPRPLIVLCASGGGLRSATWTAGILGRLDALPGFRAATRLVTGASGGMVGAAAWVALADAVDRGEVAPPAGWSALMEAVAGMSALDAVARRLVFRDLPLALTPFVNRRDRGEALAEAMERHLRRTLGCRLGRPLVELRQAEARGALPSVVFTPMLVEDGRRLVIGNLDLSRVTDHRVRWLSSEAAGARCSTGLASRSAYHAAHLFPEAWVKLRLSTAARLSAAFPYASPATMLPTRARRRVVDAGYYDNYGLGLGCAWLRRLFTDRERWFRAHVARVLVVQVRDNVSQLSVNPESERELRSARRRGESGGGALARGLEGLTSPPEGMLSARESVMLFRNDGQLEALGELFGQGGLGPDFLTTTIFEFRGEASLSWALASDEARAMVAQAGSPGISGKLEAVRRWLG